MKLHLGCGKTIFPNWVNVDLYRKTPKVTPVDLSKKFPWGNETVEFIFTEHFLEHLNLQQGLYCLSECLRVLKKSGVIRVTMPDLKTAICNYEKGWQNEIWAKQELRKKAEGHKSHFVLETGAEFLDACVRNDGHLFLYDHETLKKALLHVGFKSVIAAPYKESSHSELKNLETRCKEQDPLIMEAIK